jgi:hypothetical protein
MVVKTLGIAWLSILLSFGLTQSSSPETQGQLLSDAELTRLVAGARSEVLIEVSLFDQRPLAEGLRVATAERGARGYILVAAATAEAGSSYLPWASILPNTSTRLLAHTRSGYVVIDRRLVVLITEHMGLPVWRVEENPVRVAALVRQFVEAFRIARPYSIQGMVQRRLREEFWR